MNTLNESYNYRLALSATIERYNDEEGTNSLFDFFGQKCISYTLEQAIKDHKLTRYFYYPIPVSLTEDELEEYEDLSYQISREVRIDKKTGKKIMSERGKKLLIDRARVVAGAKNKITVLIELLKNEKNSNHMLIYCGATTVNDSDFSESQLNEGEIKQIDEVTNLLTNYLGIKATRFTSRESAEDRRKIIKNFDKAQMCQALVAIKCLDEGVSVKSIEKAFILASSTNPREYVQRRGRVLRLYEGKEYAYIYDFITLPRDLDSIKDGSGSESDLSLIKREIIRLKDFAKLAENQSESDKLLDQIEIKYGRININEESYSDD